MIMREAAIKTKENNNPTIRETQEIEIFETCPLERIIKIVNRPLEGAAFLVPAIDLSSPHG